MTSIVFQQEATETHERNTDTVIREREWEEAMTKEARG